MKLNELKSGKKVYVLMHSIDEGDHTEDIEVDGTYSSNEGALAAAYDAWLDQTEDELLHGNGEDIVKQLNALLARPTKVNLAKFEDLANSQDVEPSFEDWMGFHDITETTLK